jgi:hypothetical protein
MSSSSSSSSPSPSTSSSSSISSSISSSSTSPSPFSSFFCFFVSSFFSYNTEKTAYLRLDMINREEISELLPITERLDRESIALYSTLFRSACYPSFNIKWTIGRKENSAPAATAKARERERERGGKRTGEEDMVPSRQEIRWRGKGGGRGLSLPVKIW